jgi:Type I phosphodiesterase / nucleotide pyrophosphatase
MSKATVPVRLTRALAASAAILVLNAAVAGVTLWTVRPPVGGAPAATQPVAQPVTHGSAASSRYVIHISVDGLGSRWYQPLLDSGALPNLARLQREGAWTHNARSDPDFTITLPNHTGMLTGRPVLDKLSLSGNGHRWTTNVMPLPGVTLHSNAGYYIPSVFDVAHDRGLTTALYASKDKFVLYDRSFSTAHGAADVLAPDHGRDKIDTFVDYELNSASMISDLLRNMAKSPAQYTFVHFNDADTAGHRFSWGSERYNAAVRAVDARIGLIVDAINASPALRNNTWIVLTADHGGTGLSHIDASQAPNYTVPIVVWGPDMPANADLYALNGASTANPGADQPDYGAAAAPIRNTDTGNCALRLLGLPVITGSLSDGLSTACNTLRHSGAPAP